MKEKMTNGFLIKDVEDYDCRIDMSIEQAIKLVDAFQEEHVTGSCSLDLFARRVAVMRVNDELKRMRAEANERDRAKDS